jgi:hypothetical protein
MSDGLIAEAHHMLAAKQKQKLDLEIKDLRKRNRWPPIVAMLLGIAGFFFTVIQFQCQRSYQQHKDQASKEVEQSARFQNQIRTDIDEVLRSAHDQGPTTARVLFLLEDMQTAMNSRYNESDSLATTFPTYQRSLTQSLAILVRDDYDLSSNPRDVSRANAILEHWQDYPLYLQSDERTLDYILYKYTEALQNFRDQNPGYVECLRVDPKTKQIQVCRKYETQKNDQALYDYFGDLVEGFQEHIELVGTNPLTEAEQQRKNKILLDFQEAICNRPVSEHFIGIYLSGGECTPRQ